VLTQWGGRWGCDILSADHCIANVMPFVWPRALEHIESLSGEPVDMTVLDDDLTLIDALTAAGFEATDEIGIATWMPAAERPHATRIADGFELAARSDDPTHPHHMTPRSGDHVAERLAECSLYQPDLDLAVYGPDNAVAAYGLFWADPVTGVGLVEPMRTEDRYQGMGLARHLLAAGLDRLAGHGCSRFKVSYLVGNDASRRLYLHAGFRPGRASRTYRHHH
jgi:RimJ/RimL family protein N-acetyltransferase